MAESAGMQVDTALVRELAELLDANALTEIEVKDGDRVIRVVRTAAVVTYAAGPAAAPAP
ncbi:acetyl-CoA carboxylase biotin carboxyl carrier protein subunit, partial [alpha proteobacterium AAP81b]